MGEPAIDFKDGDDGGGPIDQRFEITVVTNGFILECEDDSGTIFEVFHDIDDVFKSIQGKL